MANFNNNVAMFYKHKNFILLLLILALVLIVWGVKRDSSFRSTKGPSITFNEKVDRIEITGADKNHVLVKEEDEWKVKEDNIFLIADAEAIKQLIELLNNFETTEIVSQNQDKYDTFQVGKDAFHISWFTEDKKLGDLYVGENDFTRGGDYVRIDGDPLVYLSKASIRLELMRSTFKDLKLVEYGENAIERVVWEYLEKDKSFVVLKQTKDNNGTKEETWVLEGEEKTELDTNAITAVIRTLKNTSSVDVQAFDKTRDYGFSTPLYSIELTDSAKKVYKITFGKKEETDQYYVQVDGKDEWVYLLNSAFVEDTIGKEQQEVVVQAKEDGKDDS